MAEPEDENPPKTAEASARSRSGTLTRIAIGLVIFGVVAMVLPGLLRDGVCGLVACADVTPEVAVGRPAGPELAVVIPEGAADELASLRLFEISNTTATSNAGSSVLAGSWIIQRTDDTTAPTVVAFGDEPEGFETRTELLEQPTTGLWVIDASFGCASTSVRFAPEQLDPGFVTEGQEPMPIGEFNESARDSLRCADEAPGWQRVLFILGALAASIGAVIGIVVVFRGPVREQPDWYDDENDFV